MRGIRFCLLALTTASIAGAQTPAPLAIAPSPRYAFEFTHSPNQQPDPADSLYRVARDFLNRGDWGRAARTFRDVATKFPHSTYEADLPYWEAFARYRIGTSDELRTAAKLLEPRASKLIGVVNTSSPTGQYASFNRRTQDADVVGLYIRVNQALASRGDSGAGAIVARAAQAGGTCDRDEMSVKTEAIGALTQMDPASALPILQGVLAKRDECSADLRKSAVFVLGRRGDSVAATMLASAAKADPSRDVRVAAITWLPKLNGDAGVNMLQEILSTETDERIQRAVVSTLTASDNPRARSSMRALIERKDASTSLRVAAVSAFNSDRATVDDAAFLRAAYARVDNELVKDAIVNTIGRIGGAENDQWLLALARNQSEPSQFRATAIGRLVRQSTPIPELMRLYEISDTYDARSRIVGALEGRREPEAGDRLVEIFRTTTEKNIKSQVLNALGRRKDARVPQLVQETLGIKP